MSSSPTNVVKKLGRGGQENYPGLFNKKVHLDVLTVLNYSKLALDGKDFAKDLHNAIKL